MIITKKGYNEEKTLKKVGKDARKHRKRQMACMPEVVTIKYIGGEPTIDETDVVVQREREQSQPHENLAREQEELRDIQDKLAELPNPKILLCVFCFLLIVEFFGFNELLRHQGFENPGRTVIALSASAILFFLIWKAGETKDSKKHVVWHYVIILGIGLFVLAMGMLRYDEASIDGMGRGAQLALSVVLTALTCGPALIAESVFKTMKPVRTLVAKRALQRRRIHDLLVPQNAAIQKVEDRSNTLAWWRLQVKKIHAAYLEEYGMSPTEHLEFLNESKVLRQEIMAMRQPQEDAIKLSPYRRAI